MTKTTYSAALYLRLSHEEDAIQESNSIKNQRRILEEYAASNQFDIRAEYIDDGYSGTNFERPGFSKMMEDIFSGKIDMILTKDLSRLGRDHITVGMYLERIFPQHNVRYIALGDNYDSEDMDTPAADMVPLINYFNEYFAKQTSRKIRAAKVSMAKAGKFVGSKAPFGYLRDPQDPHHLVVDEEAAEAVRLIFQMACEGLGYKAIARRLRERNILNPNAYNNAKFPDFHQSEYWKRPHDWHPTSIKVILENPTYLGKIVSGRRSVPFKSKKTITVPKDKWIVVDDMHEAIISQDVWRQAHIQMNARKKHYSTEPKQIFAGLLKCADCGYALSYMESDGRRYQCSQYNVKGKDYCTSHHIKYDELYRIVLADIQYRSQFPDLPGCDLWKMDARELKHHIAHYRGIDTLNATILRNLFEKIEVGGIKMVGGHKHRNIKLFYCYGAIINLCVMDGLLLA